MKAILMSIQPKHLVNILNGDKTLEIRKSVPTNFVGWVYLYCTLDKKYSYAVCEYQRGKVVARFWFDEHIKLDYEDTYSDEFYWRNSIISGKELEKVTCLSQYDIVDYGKNKPLYAWHIKKLEIFKEPMRLSDFHKQLRYPNGMTIEPHINLGKDKESYKEFELKKAPRSWMYVEVIE